MSSLPDGLRLAVGTLTVLPVRPPSRVDRPAARVAMLLAPVAAVPLGLAAALVGGLHHWLGLTPLVAGGLALGAVALGSRALHLDGLADTADGLGSGGDGSRALEIMRRGDIGPMGVATLVLVLLVQAAAAGALLVRPWGFAALGVLVCLSRSALYLACAEGVPAARPTGLGATVASVVPRAAVAIGVPVAAVVATLTLTSTGAPWWLGAAAVAAGAVVVAGVVMHCRRRFGGITGDVLGAAVEIDLLVLLVVGSAGGLR